MASSSSPAPSDREPLRERVPPGSPANPRALVIVPTLNNAADLERCLAALGRQEHRDFAVVVVDSHSTDRTSAVAAADDDQARAVA